MIKKYILTITLLLIPFKVYALDLNSTNYIMYNMDTNKIIFEENSSEIISIASLTKIATAITIIENTNNLNDKITITSEMLDGLKEANASTAGFWVGQNVTIKDLLYGLMLPSGADAANALDYYMEANGYNLIILMNDLVSDLNLNNTNFVNTTGLDDTNHYSTAYDISQILIYALKNETFKELFTTYSYLTSDGNITFKATYITSMSYYNIDNDYILGAKTGYETTAGLCLASISYFNNTNFLLVTAGAPRTTYTNHIVDTLSIYSYVDSNYKYNNLFNENDIISYIPTEYSNVFQYNVIADNNYEIYSENKNDYNYEFIGIDVLNPSNTITNIGFINIYYKDYLIDQIEIEYDGSLSYSIEGYISYNLNTILVVSATLIVIFLGTIIISQNKKSR